MSSKRDYYEVLGVQKNASKEEIKNVVKDSMAVMRGIMENGLYSEDGEVVIGSTATATGRVLSKTELWHMRLDHVSEGVD